jgi:hypothetical protein
MNKADQKERREATTSLSSQIRHGHYPSFHLSLVVHRYIPLFNLPLQTSQSIPPL